MADGPCELAFAEAAQKDGVVLAEPWLDWLCEQGHLGIGRIADESEDDAFIDRVAAPVELLGEIYYDLGGDLAVRYACRANLLIPGGFIHEPSGTLIELDEVPHFTSFRLMTLDRYLLFHLKPDLPGGDPEAMRRSLRDVVLPLPDDMLVLPGHGPGTTIARERATNPHLQGLTA